MGKPFGDGKAAGDGEAKGKGYSGFARLIE